MPDVSALDAVDTVTLSSAVYSGPLSVIIPIGDTNHENSGRTTATTVGEEAAVFTYSEAVTAFDTPPTTLGPGRIPLITFNGTDEEADTPDAAYWSRDDAGGANGFSVGVWANVTNTAAGRAFLGKFDDTGAAELREWLFFVVPDDTIRLFLYDESANVSALRTSDAAITMGSMRFFVATYDGAGGATAADTITLYEDGVAIASTATNNGAYVGMEDLATVVSLGRNIGSGRFFDGEMAGGPLAPFWIPSELTADAVKRLYQLGRVALDV